MFGDDPNPTVTTARVGSETAFRCVREEGRRLTREVRLGLAVGRELWLRRERRKCSPARFSETEKVRH